MKYLSKHLLFFEDFDDMLGSCDAVNISELKEGAVEKSSFNPFDGIESTSTCSKSETSADDATSNQGDYFEGLNFNLLPVRPNFN